MKFLLLFFSFSLSAIIIQVPNTEKYEGAPDISDHPGLFPFISHLTFRSICDHWIDQNTEWFDPEEVQQGDLVYLNGWYLEWFVKYVHDQIRFPYILITADVGNWYPDQALKKLLLDPKLAAWFCRNIIFSGHPKLFNIPMGQDLALFYPTDPNITDSLINCIHRHVGDLTGKTFPSDPRQHWLYMNHYPREHGDRDKIIKLFENESYCLSRNRSDQPYQSVDRETYYEEIASSHFTLSPVGYETDSVRTWEAFILGSIPIVEHTFNDPIYEGMPIVIVHDWKEVTLPFLENKYKELQGLTLEKAYFPYWENLIRKMQTKVKLNDFSYTTEFKPEDLETLRTLLSDYSTLIYKGGLTVERPFQLEPFFSSIHLFDPWFDPELIFRSSKITLIPEQKDFNRLLEQIHSSYAIFLDFTYYRHSLMTDFSTDFRFFTHLLKNDLHDLYKRLPLFTQVCGNKIDDYFVNEVLEQFSQEAGITIERTGSFWSFIKSY